jgi:hypothetical protein
MRGQELGLGLAACAGPIPHPTITAAAKASHGRRFSLDLSIPLVSSLFLTAAPELPRRMGHLPKGIFVEPDVTVGDVSTRSEQK